MVSRALVLLSLLGVCFAGTNSSVEDELYSASALSDIRADDAKPFQLEIDFRLQLNTSTDGHFTLKWVAKDRWSQLVTFADFRQLEVRKGENLYIVRNAPLTPLRVTELVGLLNVFPAKSGQWQIKNTHRQMLDSIAADCLKIKSRTRQHWNPDIEVCVDSASKDVLSDDHKDDDGLRREEFADYQPFGVHRYPRRLKLSRNGSVLVNAQVVSLEATSFDESLFAAPAGSIVRRQCENMAHPVAIRQPEPRYPTSAAQNRIGGLVIVSLTVQTDGSVSDVQYLERAGHEMDEVTKQIVETWKFKPAMCGSEPVASDIRVEMTFHP